jgi:hypothetical protein
MHLWSSTWRTTARREETPLATTIPPGRMVVTWPLSLDQLPPMMDYDIRHGRTYMYFRQKPLYPFG